MKQLTSVQNSLVKKVSSLKDKKGRTEHQAFIAEGWRCVESFLSNGWIPENIFVTRDVHSQLSFLHAPDMPIVLVGQEIINRISSTKTPSGVVAVFSIPQRKKAFKLKPGIVLADICDSGNMGTLIRTAAGFGHPAVVIVEGCDPWSPKVVQASAGALAFISIIQLSWQELLHEKGDLKLCALVAPTNTKTIKPDLCNALLVVGNEAHGISDEWLSTCDTTFSLPMPGKTESFNAAVAGSIALYIQYEACSRTTR